MFKNQTLIYAGLVVIILAATASWLIFSANNKQPRIENKTLAELAQCLTKNGWTMYGLDSCPHCLDQKRAFSRAFKYIDYVECRQEPQKCLAAQIEFTPTWLGPNGERLVGFQSLEQLAKISGCPLSSQTEQTSNNETIKQVKIKGATVQVELVREPAKQAQGLAGRASLPENQGMLFVFEKPGQYSFWMKDMRFALDIIWISADGQIVDLAQNISPETYPQQTFKPKKPALYVLEVNAGFAKKHGLTRGDKVEFIKSEN